jgi:hypothetical protein
VGQRGRAIPNRFQRFIWLAKTVETVKNKEKGLSTQDFNELRCPMRGMAFTRLGSL